jgi:hypothetical protein
MPVFAVISFLTHICKAFNTLMKQLLLVIFFAALVSNAGAQTSSPNRTAFSIGGELTIPSYGLYSVGTGISAKFEFPVVTPVSISLTGNFTSVFYRHSILSNYGDSGADLFVPLKGGLKYYPISNLYIEGEGGVALELNHTQRHLGAFSIGPGFIVPGSKGGLDIGFRYEDWQGQVKQTVIRVAHRFGG